MRQAVKIRITDNTGIEKKGLSGIHMEKDGVHYLFYEDEGQKCRMTIGPEQCEIRRGEDADVIRIVRNETVEMQISTPYGQIPLSTLGRDIVMTLTENRKIYELNYDILQDGALCDHHRVVVDAVCE